MDKAIILKGIADNPALMEELRTLLLKEADLGVGTNMSNEQLGENVRATMFAKNAIDRAFDKVLEYRTPIPKVEGKHPGR